MVMRRLGGPGMHGVGGVPLSSMGGGALGTYAGKMLGYGPIAYWPLWEKSGTTAVCLVNSAQNGTYRNDVGAQDVSLWPTGAGIGDGNPAPYFNSNYRVDVYSAAFNAAYNQPECTVCGWAKVDAGVWTDGNARTTFFFYVDGNNTLHLQRGANNINTFKEEANGTNKFVNITPGPSLEWWHWAITVSESADEIKVYLNGTQEGATVNGLGAWAGPLSNTNTIIGHISTTSATLTSNWLGYIAHVAVFDSPLAQPVIANLATV